ncbi:hypothetical protein CGMCC3_g13258 [Colletotrichum fructicola]|nr:uncharacterized protein CGMCC3_g13258 [Colletotrichum fructicola]KAE9570634.1 hypothetical protein CGMCC3_g13258 [Colletotrichum fructicola]
MPTPARSQGIAEDSRTCHLASRDGRLGPARSHGLEFWRREDGAVACVVPGDPVLFVPDDDLSILSCSLGC